MWAMSAISLGAACGRDFTASVGAIQRGLLRLEEEGGDRFFGEPALDIMDLLQTDSRGRGVVNILAADALMDAPRLYSSVLLWLLSELFERLPRRRTDKAASGLLFRRAHLLFDGAPPVLLQKDRAGDMFDPFALRWGSIL